MCKFYFNEKYLKIRIKHGKLVFTQQITFANYHVSIINCRGVFSTKKFNLKEVILLTPHQSRDQR